MRNIRRVDHEGSGTHCWRVTVQRRTRVYVRNFRDSHYGDAQQAFEAAQLYRDSLIQSPPPLTMPAYCAIRKKNNRSGISGLMRVDRWKVCKGRPQHKLFWEAQWPIGNGRAQHKMFSILKYGEDGAFQKALTAREAALQALSNQTFSPVAALPSRSRPQTDAPAILHYDRK
jgi:hypothetical protein